MFAYPRIPEHQGCMERATVQFEMGHGCLKLTCHGIWKQLLGMIVGDKLSYFFSFEQLREYSFSRVHHLWPLLCSGQHTYLVKLRACIFDTQIISTEKNNKLTAYILKHQNWKATTIIEATS
ncbi:hypothetical protein ACS0TY_010765 [Phlomoides rotata]